MPAPTPLPTNFCLQVSDDDTDGDYASVGGTTVGSIRAWLRHIREFLYQTLGLLPTHCPAALGCAQAQAVFAPAVFSYVEVGRLAVSCLVLSAVLQAALGPSVQNSCSAS